MSAVEPRRHVTRQGTVRKADEYSAPLSSRLDKSWMVLASHQTNEANRCVDIFSRPDGTFGFEEFRRDPEDMGAWTPVSYFSGREYRTEDDRSPRRSVSCPGSVLSWIVEERHGPGVLVQFALGGLAGWSPTETLRSTCRKR
jgi:hypothetical protein